MHIGPSYHTDAAGFFFDACTMVVQPDSQQLLSSLTCILFDMDGVLVDVSGSYRRAIIETAHHFLQRDFDPALIQSYKNRGGFNDDWELTHAIVRDRGGKAGMEEVTEIFQRLYRGDRWDGYIAGETSLISTEVLSELGSRFALGVVTGRPEAEARWTLGHFGWDDFFPVVVAKEQQQGRGKPDPFPIEQALRAFRELEYSHEPSRTTYIGDTVDDMQAGIAAGVHAIGFVPPYLPSGHATTLFAAGAHAVVHDTQELLSLLADAG